MILVKLIPFIILPFLLFKAALSATSPPTWSGTNLIQAGICFIIEVKRILC